ncbi:MAG TPA: glycosyltransferase [Caulobacterales bacterium]|nr:glycosyltransferase [Caulobacterales bacterium]
MARVSLKDGGSGPMPAETAKRLKTQQADAGANGGRDVSISVILPAYNAEGFVARAIRSALDQTLAPLEVIVVDDASSDNTADAVLRIAAEEPRIRLLRLNQNSGPGPARNRGLDAARGDWVAMLDADDVFGPERLKALASLAGENDADIVADNLYAYDFAAGQTQRTAFVSAPPGAIDTHAFVERCSGASSADMDWGLLHPMVRTQFLRDSGVRYPKLRHAEDFAFMLDLLLAGARFFVTPAPHYFYTTRHGQISGQPSTMSRTKIDYDGMRRWTERIVEDPRVRDDARLVRLLKERARGIAKASAWHKVYAYGRNRDYAGLALFAATNRFAAQALAGALRNKIAKRL